MIGVFDSGYGGLTVLKPILDLLPEYDYIYLGDNARVPYGNHSEDSIKKFSEESINYLWDRGAVLIIVACNTVSSVALRYIQQKYLNAADEKERKVLGVVIPVAEFAANKSKSRRIGVVGTKATVNSETYLKEIAKINKEINVHQQACPLLVPLIEEDWHKKPEAKSILKKYLRSLKSSNIDTLILGCTHYPFMHQDFSRYMGKKVQVLESGNIVAESLKEYLKRHPEIEQKISKGGKTTFLTTDSPEAFKDFAKKHLGLNPGRVEKVVLPQLTTPTQ